MREACIAGRMVVSSEKRYAPRTMIPIWLHGTARVRPAVMTLNSWPMMACPIRMPAAVPRPMPTRAMKLASSTKESATISGW